MVGLNYHNRKWPPSARGTHTVHPSLSSRATILICYWRIRTTEQIDSIANCAHAELMMCWDSEPKSECCLPLGLVSFGLSELTTEASKWTFFFSSFPFRSLKEQYWASHDPRWFVSWWYVSVSALRNLAVYSRSFQMQTPTTTTGRWNFQARFQHINRALSLDKLKSSNEAKAKDSNTVSL